VKFFNKQTFRCLLIVGFTLFAEGSDEATAYTPLAVTTNEEFKYMMKL